MPTNQSENLDNGSNLHLQRRGVRRKLIPLLFLYGRSPLLLGGGGCGGHADGGNAASSVAEGGGGGRRSQKHRLAGGRGGSIYNGRKQHREAMLLFGPNRNAEWIRFTSPSPLTQSWTETVVGSDHLVRSIRVTSYPISSDVAIFYDLLLLLLLFSCPCGGFSVDGGSLSRGSLSYPDSDHRTRVWVRRPMGSHDKHANDGYK